MMRKQTGAGNGNQNKEKKKIEQREKCLKSFRDLSELVGLRK